MAGQMYMYSLYSTGKGKENMSKKDPYFVLSIYEWNEKEGKYDSKKTYGVVTPELNVTYEMRAETKWLVFQAVLSGSKI